MEHVFVSYEIAKKLKQKGFDEPCLAYYLDKKFIFFVLNIFEPIELTNSFYKEKTISVITTTPTYQQVIDWLFEKHNIWITIENHQHSEPTNNLMRGFYFYIEQDGHCVVGRTEFGSFESQYNALEEAIEQALKLI